MTIYILNTTIITTPGLTYHSRRIGLVEAKSLLGVGTTDADRATDLAAALLGREVAYSRAEVAMAPGDLAICVKLRTRAPEGKILTRAEVEAVGYDLVLLTAEDPAVAADQADLMRHVAELLCYPDDDNHDAEQHPGSRRGGCYPAEVHYVVRLPVARGATYREVTQEHGTLAWSVRDVSAEEAERSTRP